MSERARRRLAVILVVVATLTGILALIATWTKRQVFDTDQWVETSSALLADDQIRERLADNLTTQIFGSGVVEAELAKLLPPKAAPLAGPASAGLSQLFDRAVNKLLQSSAIQSLWEEANRKASETFIAIANDEPIATGVLAKAQSAAGSTTLDLSTIRATVTEKLGIELPKSGIGSGEAAQAAVEAGDAQAGIEVLAPDEISIVRDIATLIQKGSVVLLLLTVLLYVIAIAITGGRRLRTVTQVGLSLILVGFVTLTARNLLGTTIVDDLAASDAAKPAVDAVWEIGTELLRTMAVASIAYGVVILLGALLAGPTRGAAWVRERIAPGLRDPMWATFGTLLLIIVLVWWGPTPALHEPLGIVLIAALLVAGVAAIRAQTIREFPVSEQRPGG
ncbi:MAG TPA: hypothetical protein VFH44_01995 [Solirubrobacterales bacterium]|nr:hypothetical protein [Solirubrobacterales bacterium]